MYNPQVANIFVYAGNPNGNLAGNAGVAGGSPPDFCWNSSANELYTCTTTGSSAAAVWTLNGAQPLWGGVAGGTANALTVSTGLGLTTLGSSPYFIGFRTGGAANTTGVTLAADSIGAKTLQSNGGGLAAGNLSANTNFGAIWDGTYWQLISGSTGGGGASASAVQAAPFMF